MVHAPPHSPCHAGRPELAASCGEVEVDETFIGGKARNMHKAKRGERITAVGRTARRSFSAWWSAAVRWSVGHVDTRKQERTPSPDPGERRSRDLRIFTDELLSYDGLSADYKHAVINHAVEYVRGNVHTNTHGELLESVKRRLHGTYISVEPFHLFRYLDEQAFRYNNRKDMDDADRFSALAAKIVGKRLTFAQVTGKTGETSRN